MALLARKTGVGFEAAWIAVVLIVGATASCTSDAPAPAPPTAPPPVGTPLEVDPTPVVSIGALGDTLYELDAVRSPFLLPNGNIVVTLEYMRVLRVYDSTGQFVMSLGREGDGPGEFSLPTFAWARGDTIEVWDRRHRRMTRFLPDGSLEVVTVRTAPMNVNLGGAIPGILPDGWAIAAVVGPPEISYPQGGSASGPGRDVIEVHGFSRRGGYWGKLASAGGITRYRTQAGGGGTGVLSPRALVRLSGGKLYVAETLTPTIRIYDPGGELLQEISWTPDPSPYSADDAFEIAYDSALARALPENVADLRARLGADPYREDLSVFWDFRPDELGFLWVSPYVIPEHANALRPSDWFNYVQWSPPGGEWMILSPDGARVGTVKIPDGFRPYEINADLLVGVWVDEQDVEHVRVHRIRRLQ